MYGIEFSPRDLRLSLVEASGSRLGTPIDQALLYCFRYDPVIGKYNVIVMSILRLVGLATVAGLGTFIAVMWRRDRRRALAARGGA
jgi:protein SCO1/2